MTRDEMLDPILEKYKGLLAIYKAEYAAARSCSSWDTLIPAERATVEHFFGLHFTLFDSVVALLDHLRLLREELPCKSERSFIGAVVGLEINSAFECLGRALALPTRPREDQIQKALKEYKLVADRDMRWECCTSLGA